MTRVGTHVATLHSQSALDLTRRTLVVVTTVRLNAFVVAFGFGS